MRDTTDHTQPKVEVSDATFPWWLTPWKKIEISIDLFQRYWWSRNPAIWSEQRHTWPHLTKNGSLRCYLPLIIISIQLIPLRDTDDQRILQFDWTRCKPCQSQSEVVVQDLKIWSPFFKGCVHYIFSSLFFTSKREHL